jgi:hypothetical protein
VRRRWRVGRLDVARPGSEFVDRADHQSNAEGERDTDRRANDGTDRNGDTDRISECCGVGDTDGDRDPDGDANGSADCHRQADAYPDVSPDRGFTERVAGEHQFHVLERFAAGPADPKQQRRRLRPHAGERRCLLAVRDNERREFRGRVHRHASRRRDVHADGDRG